MFKKIIKYFFVILGAFVLIFSTYSFINYRINIKNYEENMSSTIKTKPENVENIINENEVTIIYFGRASCPYCRVFSKELAPAIEKTDTKVYQIQTTTDSKNEALDIVRKEYDIEYVPTLLKVTPNEIIKYDFETDLELFLSQ